MSESNAVPEASQGRKYFFFVDNVKYEHDASSITGAEIKTKVPGFDPSYSLFLEGHGNDPDRLVQDSEGFSLERQGQGPLKFYTVPPAQFGHVAC